MVDLRHKKHTGDIAEVSLENANMTCNKNAVPFDPEKPMVASGVRLGTPAGTTRGFGQAEFKLIGEYMVEVLNGLATNGPEGNLAVEKDVSKKVLDLCCSFPVYGDAIG